MCTKMVQISGSSLKDEHTMQKNICKIQDKKLSRALVNVHLRPAKKPCKSQDLQESITLDQPKGFRGPSKVDGVGFQQQQFRNPKGISSHSTDTKPI